MSDPTETKPENFKEFEKEFPELASLILAKQRKNQSDSSTGKSGMARYKGTYYKEHFARELIFVLDSMLEDDKDRMYFYSKFSKYTKTTLEMKLRQSWLYVMDNLDPDGKYKALWSKCTIGEDRNKAGIRITRLRDLTPEDIVMPDIIEEESRSFEWRPKLDRFLLEAEAGQVFRNENLSLSDDDVEILQTNLSMLSGIEYKVTNQKIVVMKVE